MYSFTPINQPGGGGWSIMVFSLGSLYEDYDHMLNLWTVSNLGLPLVRYTGCCFKFFQCEHTDYVVIYDTCWPMVDTPDTHADCAPGRMLTRKHRIIIPSRDTKHRRKPYKKVKIRPPSQMTNKWYFQKDICNTPLLMLTVSAVNLNKPFCNDNCISNNITFQSLNTFLFQNPQFQHFPLTTGYSHKILNGHSMYLYATLRHQPPTTADLKDFLNSLIFLGNPKENQPGKPYSEYINGGNNTKQNWGNPFYRNYLDRGPETSYTIYTSKITTLEIESYLKNSVTSTIKNTDFQTITGPITYILTYNPTKDTGENTIYLIDTQKTATYDLPENQSLIYEGLPLYYLLWGWTDFIKKLKIINTLDYNSILLIRTKVFSDNTLNIIFPIDEDFLDGYDPYQHHSPDFHQQDHYNNQNWFPKLQFQNQTINKICMSGPHTPKPQNTYLQAQCKYTFYFKWGGCPKKLEKAFDPCLQSKWPTPDNIAGRLTIQNPNTKPQTELYTWDWDEDYIKEKAIKRIQTYTSPIEPLLISTESKANPKAIKAQEESPSKEEEKNLFLQLHELRRRRLHLELQCKLQLAKLKSPKVT